MPEIGTGAEACPSGAAQSGAHKGESKGSLTSARGNRRRAHSARDVEQVEGAPGALPGGPRPPDRRPRRHGWPTPTGRARPCASPGSSATSTCSKPASVRLAWRSMRRAHCGAPPSARSVASQHVRASLPPPARTRRHWERVQVRADEHDRLDAHDGVRGARADTGRRHVADVNGCPCGDARAGDAAASATVAGLRRR